jgi:hypothetical protein
MPRTDPLAWFNDENLKADVMKRLRAHRAADDIIKGTYQRAAEDSPLGYRGCAIGCTLPKMSDDDTDRLEYGDGSWHQAIEDTYGIPARVARWIDNEFESLPVEDAGDFAVTVIDAIPVGADLFALLRNVRYAAGGEGSWCWTCNSTHQPLLAPNTATDLIDLLASAPIGHQS